MLGANLAEYEPKDVVNDFAALNQPHRWDDHTLLVHLLKGTDARRSAAPYVDVMRNVCDVAEKLVLIEQRRDQSNVVEVHPSEKRMVDEDRIAGTKLSRAVLLDGDWHHPRHRSKV